MAGKFAWGVKAKHCWALSTNLWKQNVCWHHPAMFCLIISSKVVLIPTPRVGSKCTQIKIYNKKPCTPVTFDFDFLTISSKNAWYQKFILCKRSSRPKIFQDGIFLKFFIRDKRNYDTMTIFIFELIWNCILDFLDLLGVNPIPNRLGHVIYNERADSALTW